MKKVLVILSVVLVLSTVPVLAQEPESFTDPFENPTLPGWEHNEHVSVAEDKLLITPGGFIMRPGNWKDFSLQLDLQFDGDEGALLIGYHTSEQGAHVAIIERERVVFQRITNAQGTEQVTDLGAIPLPISLPEGSFQLELVAVGEQQVISINELPVAAMPDLDPANGGGIFLEVVGSQTVEIDSLAIWPGGELPEFDLGYGDQAEHDPLTLEYQNRAVSEGFESGHPTGEWDISEEWTFEDGIAFTEAEEQGLFVEGDWSEITLFTRFITDGDSTLAFQTSEEGAYFLTFQPDGVTLTSMFPWPAEDEVPELLNEVMLPVADEWHELELAIHETQLIVWLGGEEIMHVENPDLHSGSVGFINHRGYVVVDYLEIFPPEVPGEDEPPQPEPQITAQPAPPSSNAQPPVGICSASSAGNVNVRLLPSTQDPIVGNLAPGVFLTVHGRNAANWYQVNFNGQTAWVSGDVTYLNGPCSNIPLIQGAPQATPQQPPSNQGQTGANAADLAVTDIYPETPNGPMMFRITNHGPAHVNANLVSNCTIARFDTNNNQTASNAQNPSHQVNLAPGQTAAFNTSFGNINTNQEGYDITCRVQLAGDPNTNNNAYSESFRPILQGTLISTDLAVTDLFSTSLPQGQIYMRITNNGPDAINGPVDTTCIESYHPYSGGSSVPNAAGYQSTINVTLNPGQTGEFATSINVDTTNGWYDIECTVNAMFDPDAGNNSYSETFPPPP